MTQEQKDQWHQDCNDAMKVAGDTIERQMSIITRNRVAAASVLAELELRYRKEDAETHWMLPCIVILKNCVPPTINKQIARKCNEVSPEMAGLVYMIGETEMRRVQQAVHG